MTPKIGFEMTAWLRFLWLMKISYRVTIKKYGTVATHPRARPQFRANTWVRPDKKIVVGRQIGTFADSHLVILSKAKDLVFPCSYEILRSLRSLRMTGEGTFAEVSDWYQNLAA